VTRRHGAAAVLAAALSFCCGSAVAQDAPPKAQACVACHGPGGNSTDPLVPSLAGQPEQALANQLYQFREGDRNDPQMTPMAANLSNAEMNELAAYFSKQKPAAPSRKAGPEATEAGPRLARQYHCDQCHGPALAGLQHIPRLAGQHREYLRKQLLGFKARTRADMDGTMTQAAQPLSDRDIEILAEYLSGLGAP
jgi:cytochrome c553